MTAELEPSPLESLRRERIAACFLDSMPSDDEVNRARTRFLRSRARPRRLGTRALLITVVQGMVLGLCSAATAAFVVDRVGRRDSADAPAHQTATAPVSVPRNRARPRSLQSPAAEPPAAELPPPRAAFEDLPRPTIVTEKPLERPRQKPAQVQERDSARAPLRRNVPARPAAPDDSPAAAASGKSAALPAPAVAPTGSWERVAKALEAGDWRGADTALNDLTGSEDAHARDAAALARAQLWITHGRGKEVRGTLEQLAAHGKTPLIRRRAAALLQGL